MGHGPFDAVKVTMLGVDCFLFVAAWRMFLRPFGSGTAWAESRKAGDQMKGMIWYENRCCGFLFVVQDVARSVF